MHATTEGTTRYADRFPAFRDAAFYRTVHGLTVSTLGAGTYLGAPDDDADRAYTEALIAAGSGGVNLFDTALHYRNQRSERAMGAALRQLPRDQMVVCTKAGFLTRGAIPGFLKREHTAGGMHSLHPDFLADQVERSLANLGVDSIDVLYLHHPETQLSFLLDGQFNTVIQAAFRRLEQLVAEGRLSFYGVATWDGFRKGGLSLTSLAELAREEGGPQHHFRFLQLPFNLGMVEALLPDAEGADPNFSHPESILQTAARLGIAVISCTTLAQTQALHHVPPPLAELLPGMTNAQRAIQFARSTPGIAAALAGMGRRAHVVENLGVAGVPPLGREAYFRLYQ